MFLSLELKSSLLIWMADSKEHDKPLVVAQLKCSTKTTAKAHAMNEQKLAIHF